MSSASTGGAVCLFVIAPLPPFAAPVFSVAAVGGGGRSVLVVCIDDPDCIDICCFFFRLGDVGIVVIGFHRSLRGGSEG